MELQFWEATKKTTLNLLLSVRYNPTENSTNNNHPKVAESEIIGANHLGFAKSLFQQYNQQLELNNNHFPAESAFNFYVNDKITDCLGETVNIEFARKNFYTELFQHTSLPKNYSFTSIIREINQTIEKYTQQQFPITYTDKDKERLQTPAKITESEKEEEEKAEDQEFTYQNLILKNLEVKTPNIQTQQTQNNSNLKTINQQNLLPVIIINQPPIELIIEPIQQQPLQPPQQPQQPLQQPQQQLQPLQQLNLDPIAYIPIAKLEKFTGEEDNTQIWLNNIEKAITANEWNNARAFQAISYFLQNTTNSCNNNSINQLANTFTTIKQEKNKAVTTYLGCFYRNLHQIQAIQADYFTVPQILNQFIRGLYSSILQCIHPMHSADFQATVTNTRDFKAAKLKANHAQAVNLVMNGSSELDSKLKQFSDSINQKLEEYLADIPTHLSATASSNLSAPTNSSTVAELISKWNSKTKTDTTKLEIINEDAQPNNSETNQQPTLTSNILPATITENKSLDTIFPFELEELSIVLLFSGAILEEKPIIAMYTDAKVDGHSIKLILDIDCAASARIITTDGATKTSIGEIDDFSIEVNGIIVPIKVLIMEATQYQALVDNDWLSKTNMLLDWNMQELQISQNG
ncbi:hypothetical protein G9A89_023989 [Geosiphon pyriformis]|nr:hypothetical protein G9A89_023989 [Geosiphon pyriformis]